MQRPAIVIGLGGTGKNILTELKKIIAENNRHGMKDYPFLRFLSIDTDKIIDEKKSALKTVMDNELALDPEQEIFSLVTEFTNIPNISGNYKDISGWFPESYAKYILKTAIEKGAGQKKPIGRCCFALKAIPLYEKIKNIMVNLITAENATDRNIGRNNVQNSINVFICYSVCGGTGAGTFIDTAYMVRDIAATIGRNVYIYGLTALSTMFEGQGQNRQIEPNCYASMVELDHFTNIITHSNGNRKFKPMYHQFPYDYSNSSSHQPFDFPFLFDKTNTNNRTFENVSSFHGMAARFIYLLTGHKISDEYNKSDSNVTASIESDYKNKVLNKPAIYRSMGTYSISYPRRMIVQSCAYLLANKYFEILLDKKKIDENKIIKEAEDFLDVNKYKKDSIDRLFDVFTHNEREVAFKSYLEDAINEQLNSIDLNDKAYIIAEINKLFRDLDADCEKFKNESQGKAGKFKSAFISILDSKLKEITNISTVKNDDDKEVLTYGALIRTKIFLSELINIFTRYKEDFKSQIQKHENKDESIKSEIRNKIDDLEKTINSPFPFKKGKIETLFRDILDFISDYCKIRRDSVVFSQIFNFLDNIRTRSGGIEESGILDYLNVCKNDIDKIKDKVEKAFNETAKHNKNSINYEASGFVETIYDYKKDVEGCYERVFENKKPNIFVEISDNLKTKAFGHRYEKCLEIGVETILRETLKASEEYFFDEVYKVGVDDKILSSREFRSKIESGAYITNSDVFIGLNKEELDRVNISLDKSKFFAITIPDRYRDRPCKDIFGTGCIGRKCPVDENPENKCEEYNNCLMQILLNNGTKNLSIIPCEDTGEINIIQTIAGFPLHAVNTLKTDKHLYNKYLNESEKQALHMFGSTLMADLLEKTNDINTEQNNYKKLLLVAYSLNWLVIDKASIAFYTNRDFQYRSEKPSLELGSSLSSILDNIEKNDSEFVEKLLKFKSETETRFENNMLNDEEKKNKVIKAFKTVFTSMLSGERIPYGFKKDDADILKNYVIEKLGVDLEDKEESPDYSSKMSWE